MTILAHRSLAITIFLGLVAITTASSPASAATIIRTVGANGCDYSEIQLAIDFMKSQQNADTKIIRIARDQFYNGVELQVIDDSITLEGGYDTCASPSPGLFRSILRGGGPFSVLTISSAPEPQAVEVRNLGILFGNTAGGAGINIAGNVEVLLDSVSLAENVAAFDGGGIRLSEGSLVMTNVSFERNESRTSGGAISCFDGNILGLGGNSFRDNEALGSGGAIYLEECDMTLKGSHVFTSNSASRGGAIYGDFFDIELSSTSRGRVEIRNNMARGEGTNSGGGIFLESGSLLGVDVTLEGNEVESGHGGAITADGAVVTLMASGELSCQGGPCSALRDNQATDGAAGFVTRGGRLDIVNSRIEGNGDSSTTSTFRIEPGIFNSVGNELVSNVGQTVIDVWGSTSQATVAFSTLSNNGDLDQVIRVLGEERRGGGASVKLLSSIVWEGSGIPIFRTDFSGETLESECLVVSEVSSLPSLSNVLQFDPNFVDAAQGDYHLQPDSVAIDFCDATTYPPPVFDIDNGFRGVDDPGVVNNFPGAVLDVGADEFASSDEVFADGFESGTADGWSSRTF